MSSPSELKVFVQFDDSVLRRQISELENLMGKLGSPMGRISGGGGIIAPSQRETIENIKKQTGFMDKMRGGIADVAKNSLSLIGIGVGVGALVGLMTEASPILKSSFKLLNTGIMLMLRPIADFIGLLLRPIMLIFLTQVAIPFYKYVSPVLREIGIDGGKKIAEFFKDPIKSLHGLFVNAFIVNWGDWFNEQQARSETPPPSGGALPVSDELQKIKDNFKEGAQDSQAAQVAIEQMRALWEENKHNSMAIALIQEAMVELSKHTSMSVSQDLTKISNAWMDGRVTTDQISDTITSILGYWESGRLTTMQAVQRLDEIKVKLTDSAIDTATRAELLKGINETIFNLTKESEVSASQTRDLFDNIKVQSGLSNTAMQNTKQQFGLIEGIAISIGASLGMSALEVARMAQRISATVAGVGGIVPGILPFVEQQAKEAGLIPKTAVAQGITPTPTQSMAQLTPTQQANVNRFSSLLGMGSAKESKPISSGSIMTPTQQGNAKKFSSLLGMGSVEASKAISSGSIKFAEGGVINEHVVGMGMRSGRRYDIGESGVEVIAPPHKIGGNISISMPLQIVIAGKIDNASEIIARVWPELERRMKKLASDLQLKSQLKGSIV